MKEMSKKNNTLPNFNRARKRIKDSCTINDGLQITKKLNSLGENKTYFVRTYGCQSNVRDSEIISGILEKIGFKSVAELEKADLVILNTCAIRENAELKVFGEIGFIKKIKRKNPNFLFGIAGCMSQEEKVVKEIVEKIDHVDFVFGTHNIHRLPQILDTVINQKTSVIEVWSHEGDIIENLPSVRDSKFKAFVNIMYGCDHFCTYCIVPYTRGKIRSRRKEDILKEVNELIKNGYKEVTLLGQNVNAYGIDFKMEKYDFSDLLQDVANTKISRIRFATSNPWNFDNKIVDTITKNKNLMPYIHLPIQSGDEKVLSAMNRAMSIKKYYDIVKYIRDKIPNCTISTDLIVGFPNETKEQFENTIKLFNDIQFDNAYTFIFSARPGTPASLIKDEISFAEKQQRLQELNLLVKKYSKINSEKFIDSTLEVLVDGVSKTDISKLTGYTPEWKVVNFSGNAKAGDLVYVYIETASRFSLNGKIVENYK